MAEENKMPEIRFKGFSGDWNQCELGELLGITSASRVHKHEWTKSGVPFFRSSDVVANYKGLKNNKAFISFDLYEELSNKSGCVQKNDLLVTGGGSIGIPYLVKTNEPLYFKDADLLWLKNANNINGYFLYTFFSTASFRRYVSSITHIGTISHYTIEQAKSTPINIPEKKEQDKIGKYLTNLDILITLHQRKVDKLLNVKKAMLEKIFPKKGADVPEIRFKGFSEKWEVRKLGEVTDTYSGGTPLVGNKEYYDGEIPFIRSAEINSDSTELLITEIGLKNSSAKVINIGCILYALYGATSGEVGCAKIKGAINQAILAIIPNNEFDTEFIMQWLRKNKKEIISTYLQGGQGNLSGAIVKKLNIGFPNYQEQTKIGNFFKNLDTLLTLQQSELEKLKNIKKACLEKMFV